MIDCISSISSILLSKPLLGTTRTKPLKTVIIDLCALNSKQLVFDSLQTIKMHNANGKHL